ncbi:MAG TPA: nucleotide sugar dehydrogenase [Candidatus Saccharimonadales bacterium]|nr:nucleotide sugar dehydrogenase [Candidatus Saccharimonadales bacterium]
MDYDICIIGGCGHVGLPLGMAFAEQNKQVVLYDINQKAVDSVNAGKLPFMEEGGEKLLKQVTKSKKLQASSDIASVRNSKVVVMVIGTPVDEHLNPRVHDIFHALKDIEAELQDDQLLVMRSTLYPGTTDKVHAYLQRKGKKTLVAFCPERIVEGKALTELHELPQIVAGCTPEAQKEATELFSVLTNKVVTVQPKEAELAKLFTNTWRYINFAISNQFYMIANTDGLDFYKIYDAMTQDYPRLKAFAKAGLAAGPCLFKDTMQLAAFSSNDFFLGHSAMLINEGLPGYVVESMLAKQDLSDKTVAVLGMAFKANNDDPRESLSYKLMKRLDFEAKEVLCNDPYINDPRFVPLDEIKKRADIIVVATPHKDYADIDWGNKEVIDMWNYYGKGGLI